MTKPVGAVVLAAGKSTRMNSPKALLRFDGNHTFLGRIISVFGEWGCGEIVIVINRDLKNYSGFSDTLPENATYVMNEYPESERLLSVKLGLGAIRNASFCFLHNADNPFIDPFILDRLYTGRSGTGYVSPVFDGKGGHPVLLNRDTMNRIVGWPDDSASLKTVLNTMERRIVEMPDDRVLVNINSPEEYANYFSPTPARSLNGKGDPEGTKMSLRHGIDLF